MTDEALIVVIFTLIPKDQVDDDANGAQESAAVSAQGSDDAVD
jgi:hypothetical protein